MKLSDRNMMAIYAVAVSWMAGFMVVGVWVINQPLWFCIPITIISIACVPLMVAALWMTDGGRGNEGKSG